MKRRILKKKVEQGFCGRVKHNGEMKWITIFKEGRDWSLSAGNKFKVETYFTTQGLGMNTKCVPCYSEAKTFKEAYKIALLADW